MPSRCEKCLRHVLPEARIVVDRKNKKKWAILTCPECGWNSDILETRERKTDE